MTRRKKTDGESISTSDLNCGYDQISLAARIERLTRKRPADVYELGWFYDPRDEALSNNLYRGRTKK